MIFIMVIALFASLGMSFYGINRYRKAKNRPYNELKQFVYNSTVDELAYEMVTRGDEFSDNVSRLRPGFDDENHSKAIRAQRRVCKIMADADEFLMSNTVDDFFNNEIRSTQ